MRDSGGNKRREGEVVLFIVFLRILASCLITNTHYNNVYPMEFLAVGGLLGDALFFTISGYCLCRVRISFVPWYAKRIARIYLPTIIITAIYLLIGWYNFETFGFFKLFIFPTSYHFVASIMVLYIPFYVVCSISVLKRNIPAVISVVAFCYFIVYVFFYDKSYYHVDYVHEIFIWFLFFAMMLLGAWFRENNKKNNHSILNLSMMIVLLISYLIVKLSVSKYRSLLYFQFVTQLTLFGSIFYMFKVMQSMEDTFKTLPDKVKKIAVFISKLTLEIYIVQKPIISALERTVVFPLNWLLVTGAIVTAAIILHFICQGIIYVTNRTAKFFQEKKEKQ